MLTYLLTSYLECILGQIFGAAHVNEQMFNLTYNKSFCKQDFLEVVNYAGSQNMHELSTHTHDNQ